MSTLADRVSTLTFDNSDFDFDHLDLGLSDSDDDKKASKGLARGPGIGRPKGAPGGRTKECPSCGAMVGVSVKECKNCDHTFTAKSALAPTTTAQEESDNIRDYFPFEPEKHDDGSYKIQAILGGAYAQMLPENIFALTSWATSAPLRPNLTTNT